MEGDTVRGGVVLHDEADFVGLRAAGRLAAMTLDMITSHVKAGVTTGELDDLIHRFMIDHDSVPATLNYRGYPKSSCISLNHVVCHGIPGERVLNDGDILNIDVTCILNGWFGDSSRMYVVGNTLIKAKKLIDVTYDSMMAGISAVKPGATLGDIGYAIQKLAESHRFSVVRDFCGHGIGRTFHAPPNILHYGRPGEGMKLKAGMVFTIEPMINIGKPDVKILDDGWTAVTRDRSLTAQFEHMLGVTETGYEIFTLSPGGYTRPPYPDHQE
ncbi:type I methionyl aminopeptidase [Acetobacter oeni]|nr:type I methionyl aminopeptidase [Acetobacter oeni]MBB3881765.1 methionyl aminopeptidase [Acetobacter oeni]NHO17433.1 type I methionyl aminopeptidase [Acetobacter oeni]